MGARRVNIAQVVNPRGVKTHRRAVEASPTRLEFLVATPLKRLDSRLRSRGFTVAAGSVVAARARRIEPRVGSEKWARAAKDRKPGMKTGLVGVF